MKYFYALGIATLLALFLMGVQCPIGPSGLTMSLIDDPVDEIEEVNILIDSIVVHGSGGKTPLELTDAALDYVNLLDMQNGFFLDVVKEVPLDPGTYGNIHVGIKDANVLVKGATETEILDIPPDKINLNQPFEIFDNAITELFLVFDVRKSIKYKEELTIRIKGIKPI